MFGVKISEIPKLPTTCTYNFINIKISLEILILWFAPIISLANFHPFDKYKVIKNVNIAGTQEKSQDFPSCSVSPMKSPDLKAWSLQTAPGWISQGKQNYKKKKKKRW